MKWRLAPVALLFACGHAGPRPGQAGPPGAQPAPPPPPDPLIAARELSAEAHALLRAEGELLWKRWTTGLGALPATALAEHPRLFARASLDEVAQAELKEPAERAALQLLHGELATLALAHEVAPQTEALERARAGLLFAAPGEEKAQHGERDLDKLLGEEAAASKRAAIALEEAKAAQALLPLARARDLAQEKAIAALGLGTWGALAEELHGLAPAALADLAERTLAATEKAAARAVAVSAQQNLGITAERLRRADLPRLVRSAASDAGFPAGQAYGRLEATWAAMGLAPGKLLVDAEPTPAKGARPLALLVDPPRDVRLSLRPSGGFEEQRAVMHEGARALGGSLTQAQRWELAQLGDGAAAEGVAQLFEELSGEPLWLREQTGLRGEPLDDLVHTQATRRLLAARRAAALVLFEVKRREGPGTAEANAALYRGLLQRATLAVLTDEDAGRWALEADSSLRAATQLQGALLAAQLEQLLSARAGSAQAPDPAAAAATDGAAPARAAPPALPWWHAPGSAALLRQIWAQGRSATATSAVGLAGAATLDPAVLASVAEAQLAYVAPEAPPPTQRPDYKFMQGDHKSRRKKHKHK